MHTTKVEGGRCPHCNHLLDAHSSLEEGGPSPGDVSVCIYCTAVLLFDENLNVRVPTEEEHAEIIAACPHLPNYIMAIRKVSGQSSTN